MSRSNPYKKKRRAAKKTILIYGEGQSDEIFLKHLRKLFAQNSGVALTIKKGKGGTPQAVIELAIKYLGDFDKKVVVVDNDKSTQEMLAAQNLAKKHKINLIENTPCLEGILLLILEPNINIESKNSSCKKEFEKKYITKKQRTDKYRYEELFTEKKLKSARGRITELDRMITVIEGKS